MPEGRIQPNRGEEHAFSGVGITYCRVPLVLDPAGLAGADVAIVGAPFDEGISNRPGTRFGPRAIRLAEDVGCRRPPAHGVCADPFAEVTVVDYGDIEAVPSALDRSHAALRQAVERGGGRRGRGRPRRRPLAASPVMQALADQPPPTGTPSSTSTRTPTPAPTCTASSTRTARRSTRRHEGFMRGDHIVQMGCGAPGPTRTSSSGCATRASAGTRWTRSTTAPARRRRRDRLRHGAGAAHLPDGGHRRARPGVAPGTGTPEPGGLTTRELLRAVRTIASSVDLVAMDIVEVSPPHDHAEVTALAGHPRAG